MKEFMLPILPYLIPPLLGALIGYVTNRIAISMLFRPYREKRIFGVRLPFTPGIIPKQRYQLSKSIGKMVSSHLFTEEAILRQIGSEDFQNRLQEYLKDRLDHFLDTTPNMPLESSTAWKEFGPLVAKGGINALLDYHWESTLKELLPMIFEDEEALLLRISSALGGEKRTLGAFLPYRSALLLSNIFDERYEEVVNLVDSFLRRRRIRSQIELRGRQLLEDILDRLSRMQRFMLIAGQYDRALREKMPGIVEDALVQLHRGLKEPDVRKGVVKWVRVSLLWARKKEIASLFSLLSGGGIEPGGAFSLLAQELGNSVSSMKVSALFSRFGYDSVQSASETLVSLLFPSGDTEKRGRLSAVFASHPPSRFLRLPPERRDAMATALRTAAITLLERNIKIILDQVDVQTLVVQRVDDLEVEKVEELLLLVIKNHLAYINLFGAILGALIGALQLIISSS
jgi:hypothetical protein